MPKRKNTSIKEYYLKSGAKRYEFVISLGINSNGNRVQVHRKGFRSFAAAEIEFNKLTQTKADEYAKQHQIKLSELWALWFDNYKTQVKESTANKTQINYRVHILPHFGNNYIDRISVKDLQKWADNLAKKLVKYRDPIGIMRSLFEYAMILGYILDNPILRIVVPKRTARPRRNIDDNVYTRNELTEFLNTAKKFNFRAYVYFSLLASTGLRKSEALALTWKDIDFINNTINIDKTLTYGLNNTLIVSTPKTRTSKRIVPLSPNLKKLLIEFKNSEKILSNKLFHTLKGNYISISRPENWISKIYDLNPDLRRITVHGFRHTFATLLIEETDIKPKTVQMLLGHSNIQMTLDIYTHVNNKNKQDAINALQKLNF